MLDEAKELTRIEGSEGEEDVPSHDEVADDILA